MEALLNRHARCLALLATLIAGTGTSSQRRRRLGRSPGSDRLRARYAGSSEVAAAASLTLTLNVG